LSTSKSDSSGSGCGSDYDYSSKLVPFKIFRNLYSEDGHDIRDILKVCLKRKGELANCLIVPSFNTFYTFEEIYSSYLKSEFPQEDFTKKFENESYSMNKSLLINLQDLIESFFIEVDLTTNRNLNGFNFTPFMSSKERRIVKKVLMEEVNILEKEIFDSQGKFYKVKKEHSSEDNFLNLADVYSQWPDDRMIYLNLDSRLLFLINEEDHFKMKLNMNAPNKMTKYLLNYFEFLESIEKRADFAMHPNFGYLNMNINSCGTATRFYIKLKVASDKVKKEEIKKKLHESSKDLKFEIHDEEAQSYMEISNSNPYYTFSTFLIELMNIKDLLK
jgi:hypothetical protein